MTYLRRAMFVLLMFIYPGLVMAQTPTSSYTCNFAKVKLGSEQVTHIPVRAGAGSSFRRVDKLLSGQEVYICDERGDWFKVFYSGPDGPCGSTSKNGLDVQKTKGCRFGWVEKRWIDVISG